MQLSPSAQATLLMTSHFGKAGKDAPKPLSIAEWGHFAMWLKEQKRTPSDLLSPGVSDLLAGWHHKKLDRLRITRLLGRGHALALSVEKWQRAGLWIITRADSDYPVRLKSRLKTLSPPVLFGCGDRSLLDDGGLAVVGSRNASDEDLAFTQHVGLKAASVGVSIVSGAARGVDETAMLGAIGAGGKAVGIVADSLLRSASSKKWRNAVMDGRLVLISPFYPEAGFSVGNAMARNKYIYCLSESSLVIHSGMRGGTLNGAEENLKKNWVPLWVKPTQDKEAANHDLVARGGRWCNDDVHLLEVRSLFVPTEPKPARQQTTQADMFDIDRKGDDLPHEVAVNDAHNPSKFNITDVSSPEEQTAHSAIELPSAHEGALDFYKLFVDEVARRSTETFTTDQLVGELALQKTQVNAWLKRASEDGLVKKLKGPVRYQCVNKE